MQHVTVPGGVSVAYVVTGTGAPLVLIHGAEADHTMFDHFVPLLTGDFACIGYDQRDSGETVNPEAPYGIEDMADDAAGLITALGHRKAHVFGTSLGSIIAQALAVRHPAMVDRLVLSAAIRIGRSVGDIAPETAAELGRLRADPARNGMAIARYFYTEDHLAQHPELAQRFAGSKRTPAQQARRGALIPGAPLLPLGGITAPTLVLAHAEDRLIPPAHSLGIAAEIPGARTVVLDGLGHVGTIQAPERVAAVVRGFLA
ncbi:MAG TPA: alpha/beta fold hydrolase [Rhodopila sp.]|jgi:3-oxoadipate enol-lactonase|nr:alpha/beta fold hydrolase [Rhodopila sp.]